MALKREEDEWVAFVVIGNFVDEIDDLGADDRVKWEQIERMSGKNVFVFVSGNAMKMSSYLDILLWDFVKHDTWFGMCDGHCFLAFSMLLESSIYIVDSSLNNVVL